MDSIPQPSRPEREEQALREVGRTQVSGTTAGISTALFLATVSAVALLQGVVDLGGGTGAPWPRLGAFAARVSEVGSNAGESGLFAANRELLAAIERFEARLEDESLLRGRLLPTTQRTLSGLFGLGNEQAYLGRERWLFYGADFDHVTGPGFLTAGAAPDSIDPPDPTAAILALDRDLAARGIELVVLPTPVKPTIHPEFLTRSTSPSAPVQNPSFPEFVERLEKAGVAVLDPAPRLAAAARNGAVPQYLRSDTHWNPQAMARVARELAAYLDANIDWLKPRSDNLVRRRASLTGLGDIARMLRLPESQTLFEPERIEVSPVLTAQGRPWRPSARAELLVLGDSFTNVYSDPALGWGQGAGLAEQLSFELGRPVDRIATNAGGALASRQALARALAGSNAADRLAAKRVVVYQFAARELSQGDWTVLDLPDRN